MEEFMDALYEKAKRSDVEDRYQGEEYQEAAVQQMQFFLEMCDLFGPAFANRMEDFVEALSKEMELERRYFFEQGYLAGAAGKGE